MRLVRKRGRGDCGSSALACYLGVSYWDILREASIVDPERHGLDGLRYVDLIAIAQRLGVSLVRTRRFNLDEDEGVLGLRWNSGERLRKQREGHFVAIVGGDIICAELGRWPWAEYLARFDARECTILKGTL